MANELNFYGTFSDTGLSVVARVYDSLGAQAGTDVACSEVGTLAIYIGDMPASPLGVYGVRFVDTTTLKILGQGQILWDGTKEVNTLTNEQEILSLNNFDPASDVVANVTLVDTTTTNTDMAVVPTSDIAAILADTNDLQTNQIDISALALSSEIASLNDITAAQVRSLFTDSDFQDKNTEGEIHAWLDSYANKSGYQASLGSISLSPAERTAIAVAVEQSILNDGDGQAVLNAIVGAIGNSNVDEVALVAAIRADLIANNASLKNTTAEIQAAITGLPVAEKDAFKGTAADLTPVTNAIASLNDFDPSTDTVATVNVVNTVTTNTDMRGTDGANTIAPNVIAPDNASIAAILVDTNDLQTNQSNWNTANGFATPANLTVIEANIVSEIDANETKIDLLETKAQADARQTVLVSEHDSTQVDISNIANAPTPAAIYAEFTSGTNEDAFKATLPVGGASQASVDALATQVTNLNDFDPASDTVAVVNLVNTTTTNTDMRGTDGVVPIDISALSTSAEIAALNNFDPVNDEVVLVTTVTNNTDMRGTDSANTIAPDNASITNILTDTNELQLNQSAWATATGFPLTADLIATETAIIAEVDANEAKLDAIATNVLAIPTTDSVADLSAIETKAQADVRQAALVAEHATTQSDIGALNDLSAAEVTAASPTASAIATAVEAALINEGDGQQLIDAILQVFNTNLDLPAIELAAIGQAVRSELSVELARVDVAISTRSTITTTQVNVEVDTALTDYDAPTKAELDAAQTAIQNTVSGGVLTPVQVWDYLNSSATVPGSVKESLEIILRNAKLIPAAI